MQNKGRDAPCAPAFLVCGLSNFSETCAASDRHCSPGLYQSPATLGLSRSHSGARLMAFLALFLLAGASLAGMVGLSGLEIESPGSVGNDNQDGSNGDDTMSGGAGNDLLIGWDGDDSLSGAGGTDWLLGLD